MAARGGIIRTYIGSAMPAAPLTDRGMCHRAKTRDSTGSGGMFLPPLPTNTLLGDHREGTSPLSSNPQVSPPHHAPCLQCEQGFQQDLALQSPPHCSPASLHAGGTCQCMGAPPTGDAKTAGGDAAHLAPNMSLGGVLISHPHRHLRAPPDHHSGVLPQPHQQRLLGASRG